MPLAGGADKGVTGCKEEDMRGKTKILFISVRVRFPQATRIPTRMHREGKEGENT